MSLQPDSLHLLSQVPKDGSTIGNMKLRELLGWDEERYLAARQPLLDQGLLVTGRGRGGAVMRGGAHPTAATPVAASANPGSAQALEMFALEEVAMPAPARPAAAPAANAPKPAHSPVTSYRHTDATRKNIPPAGLASKSTVQESQPHRLSYDPHLSPVLRFDSTGETDELMLHVRDILEKAKTCTLTPEETQLLSDALLRSRQPWLEWAGKREKRWFEVDPVALHIHERVSANAILKAAQRQDIEHDLFADPRLSREEALQFYKHDVDWANRLILGDSLQVMSSLARREGLAGKVQMIYMDPPYGIKFSSNWQNEVGNREVKDGNDDLTREPEMIKAYRDTWTLGVHSYLDYLKQRLIVARELLTDSGSVFVQISDENLHRVRAVMDEVFGAENFISLIVVKKTGGMGEQLIDNVADFIIWYGKDVSKVKFRRLYEPKSLTAGVGERYSRVELLSGEIRPITGEEAADPTTLPLGARVFLGGPMTSQSASESTTFDLPFQGRQLRLKKGGWKTNLEGAQRLIKAGRLLATRDFVNYKISFEDFPAVSIGSLWTDTMGTAEQNKVYTAVPRDGLV